MKVITIEDEEYKRLVWKIEKIYFYVKNRQKRILFVLYQRPVLSRNSAGCDIYNK